MVAAALRNGYTGDTSNLGILDVRFGYPAEEVSHLFEAWGAEGRRMYVQIELVDMLLYFPGYGGLFLVLINRLAAYLACAYGQPALFSRAWYMLLVLILLDTAEDVCQLLLVASHQQVSAAAWQHAVRRASIANQAKWVTVRTNLCILGAMLVAAAAAAAWRGQQLQSAARVEQPAEQQHRGAAAGLRSKHCSQKAA